MCMKACTFELVVSENQRERKREKERERERESQSTRLVRDSRSVNQSKSTVKEKSRKGSEFTASIIVLENIDERRLRKNRLRILGASRLRWCALSLISPETSANKSVIIFIGAM